MIKLKGDALKQAEQFALVYKETMDKLTKLNDEFQKRIEASSEYKNMLLEAQKIIEAGDKKAAPIAKEIYAGAGISSAEANNWVIDTQFISLGVAILKPVDPAQVNPLMVDAGTKIH